jgi:two-component system chemotaxis sensor kinase CheA
VLELERKEVDDLGEVIAEIFREVHTLKGSAAVVGFEDIARYAHRLEERLGQLRAATVARTRRSSTPCWSPWTVSGR